jgi:hypothetical protein
VRCLDLFDPLHMLLPVLFQRQFDLSLARHLPLRSS